MEPWSDVQASESGSGSPWVNRKRRRKLDSVVLGKSRGRDRTVLPNVLQMNAVWPVNKGPRWPGLRSSVCVFWLFTGSVVSRFVVLPSGYFDSVVATRAV